MIHSQTETVGQTVQALQIGRHSLRVDMTEAEGGAEEGPSPHDLFDASLAGCKSLTAHWVARRKGIPLERVECEIERDDSKERQGTYVLRVTLRFHGPMTQEQRKTLHDAVARCPVHKLMTTGAVQIETTPFEAT